MLISHRPAAGRPALTEQRLARGIVVGCLTVLALLAGAAFAQPQSPGAVALIIDRRMLSAVPAQNVAVLPELPDHTLILCVWQTGNCNRLTRPDPAGLQDWALQQVAGSSSASDDSPPTLRELPGMVEAIYRLAAAGFKEYVPPAASTGPSETRLRIWIVSHPDVRLNGVEGLSLTQVLPGPACLVSPALAGGDKTAVYSPPPDISTVEIAVSLEGTEGWQLRTEQTIAQLFGFPSPKVAYLGQLGRGCKPQGPADLGKLPVADQVCGREPVKGKARIQSACASPPATVPPPVAADSGPVARDLSVTKTSSEQSVDIATLEDPHLPGTSVQIVAQPKEGTARISGGSRVVVDVPGSQPVVRDTFHYKLIDGRGRTSPEATVTFTINRPPSSPAPVPVPSPARPPSLALNCANTHVPGGMFLVEAGTHQVPDDARDFFVRFEVTSIKVDKPFCMERRKVTAEDLTDFARTDGSGWKPTDLDPKAVASRLTLEFAGRYATWLNQSEPDGTLELPSEQEWLAAFMVALSDPALKNDVELMQSFQAGAREWLRDMCEAGASPKYFAIGQTGAQYNDDRVKICWFGISGRIDTGFRIVKELQAKGSGP